MIMLLLMISSLMISLVMMNNKKLYNFIEFFIFLMYNCYSEVDYMKKKILLVVVAIISFSACVNNGYAITLNELKEKENALQDNIDDLKKFRKQVADAKCFETTISGGHEKCTTYISKLEAAIERSKTEKDEYLKAREQYYKESGDVDYGTGAGTLTCTYQPPKEMKSADNLVLTLKNGKWSSSTGVAVSISRTNCPDNVYMDITNNKIVDTKPNIPGVDASPSKLINQNNKITSIKGMDKVNELSKLIDGATEDVKNKPVATEYTNLKCIYTANIDSKNITLTIKSQDYSSNKSKIEVTASDGFNVIFYKDTYTSFYGGFETLNTESILKSATTALIFTKTKCTSKLAFERDGTKLNLASKNIIDNLLLSKGSWSNYFTLSKIGYNDGSKDIMYNYPLNGNTGLINSSIIDISSDQWIYAGAKTRAEADEYTAVCGILTKDAQDFIYRILDWIKYGALVLTIGLSIFDFFKAVASEEDDAFKKAAKKLMRRVIVVVILFLLPVILEFILKLTHIQGVTDDPLCTK